MKWIQGFCGFFFLLAAGIINAQDKTPAKFGKLSPEDFSLRASPVIDSNTNAVIIADMGITTFKGNDAGWVSYVFKRKTRIKIINKKAFELATVKIPLYVDGDEKEKADDISAAAYNLENGNVVVTKMEKKDLFTTRIDKNRLEQKFSLPGVKENSIIEYSYSITSDFFFNIPAWQFQNIDYPCLWSEYEVTIPSLVGYVFNKRGVHPFQVDKADDGHEVYRIKEVNGDIRMATSESQVMNVNATTVKHRWAMKDIPPFYVENYLSSPENYMDEIDFQLARTFNGETTREVKNSWKKVTEDLLHEKDFALFMTDDQQNYWLDKPLADIVSGNADALQGAKDIFYYLSSHFTCINHHNKYIRSSLQDVFRSQKGNVGEINLLLTAMLLHQHITAAPVVLSTREYGYNYANYPILNRLDYVVCKATINGKEYYLDASQPLLGFGHLPANCYNGHARIISAEDSASVYFLADSIRENRRIFVNITNDETHKEQLTGAYTSSWGYMESFKLRQAIAETGEVQYVNTLKAMEGDELEINRAWIDSLKRPEDPLATHIEFTIKSQAANDIIYFNPVLWGGYKSNPFTAAERKYPVEMPYPVNETYNFTMEIPEGYVIDEVPKSSRVSYNENEGFFEYLTQKNENSVQLRTRIDLKKAYFDPQEYNALREFFGYVVKKMGEQIVFKRKK